MTPKSEDFREKCSLQAICSIWAALPGAQHLERCFAPKRVFHMTRRAFLALRVIQRQGKFSSKGLVKIFPVMSQENKDFSKSVNSIDSGAIFPTRLGQDLSRNTFVVSGYAF